MIAKHLSSQISQTLLSLYKCWDLPVASIILPSGYINISFFPHPVGFKLPDALHREKSERSDFANPTIPSKGWDLWVAFIILGFHHTNTRFLFVPDTSLHPWLLFAILGNHSSVGHLVDVVNATILYMTFSGGISDWHIFGLFYIF